MAEVQDRHRVAARLRIAPAFPLGTVTGADQRLRIEEVVAQALADREAAFVAWLKDGAPRPGVGDGGCYEECMDDTLDNMVAAVESGRVVGQYDQVTEIPRGAPPAPINDRAKLVTWLRDVDPLMELLDVPDRGGARFEARELLFDLASLIEKGHPPSRNPLLATTHDQVTDPHLRWPQRDLPPLDLVRAALLAGHVVRVTACQGRYRVEAGLFGPVNNGLCWESLGTLDEGGRSAVHSVVRDVVSRVHPWRVAVLPGVELIYSRHELADFLSPEALDQVTLSSQDDTPR